MNKFLKKYYLLGVLFITGAAVLVIEVTATRILSPYFGQTVYSVSSILSVILAALSFGYYYGGILADKKPSEKLFFQIIAFSGIATIAIQFLSDILSPIIASSLPFKYGPLVLSILLFFLPALLLGMLSPFVIKLQSIKLKKIGVGRVSGQVFFVSTLGSIFGSLLAGFFLIPTFGLSQIILGCGLLLVILGLIGSKFNLSLFFAILLIAAVFSRIGVSTASAVGSDIVYAKDSVYQKIIVKDFYNQGQIDRHLFLDRNNSAAVRLGSKDLVFEYFKYYSLYRFFNHDPKKIAVIGVESILQETGAKEVAGEQGFSVAARAGARPTLDVNGIWGGYQDEGPKTIIPAEAGAKISMRLVPFQDSRDIFEKFEKYVKSITPDGVDIDIKMLSAGEPILMNRDSKYFKSAENAYQKIFGAKPVYELGGGSIPVTATFKNLMNMDSILMGYGLPDDGLHSPNEKMSLSMFEKGIKTNIEFLKKID